MSTTIEFRFTPLQRPAGLSRRESATRTDSAREEARRMRGEVIRDALVAIVRFVCLSMSIPAPRRRRSAAVAQRQS